MLVPQERNIIRDILARLSRGEANLSKSEYELLNKLWNEFQIAERQTENDRASVIELKDKLESLRQLLVEEKRKSELYRRDTRDSYVQAILPIIHVFPVTEQNLTVIDRAFAAAGRVYEEEDTVVTKPMLCKTYKEFKPSFVQPKLDGIRCIAKIERKGFGAPYVYLESRNEKPLALPHLQNPLLALFSRLNNTLFFDGELYIHGKSFQDIASMVKRGNHPHQDLISYHIYDRQLAHPWKDQRFDIRFYGVDFPKLEHIVKVPTFYCPTENDANKMHAKFVAQGYEGSIYRVGKCLYEEDKRSPNLLKRKDWQEEDFVVVKIKEGLGKNAGTAIFECEADREGTKTFDVTAPGTYKEKKKYFDHPADYLARMLSVKFQNYTDDGIPRFPIALGFKEDR